MNYYLDIISTLLWTDVVVVTACLSLRLPLLKLFQLLKDTQLAARSYKVLRAKGKMFDVTLVLSAHSSRKSTLTWLESIAAGEHISFSHENKGAKEAFSRHCFYTLSRSTDCYPLQKNFQLRSCEKNNLDRWRPESHFAAAQVARPPAHP